MNEINKNAECRFCLMDGQSEKNPLINPCKCNGSIEFVHKICLSKWRNTDIRLDQENKCPLCLSEYDGRLVYRIEIIPDYDDNKYVSFLIKPASVFFLLNSFFFLYLSQAPMMYELCEMEKHDSPTIYYNISFFRTRRDNYICSNQVLAVDMVNFFNVPYTFSHYSLNIIYLIFLMKYISQVKSKHRYLIKSIRLLWMPFVHLYIFFSIYKYTFAAGLLHHLILPAYFSAHLETLRLMNNDF